MDVVFKSNLDLVLRTIRDNNEAAAAAAENIAIESVQEQMLYGYHDLHGRPPHAEIVDTGALFDSIAAEIRKVSQNVITVSTGTPLKYGIYVHEGYTQPAGLKFIGKDGNWYTTKGGHIVGRPYLKDGLMAAEDKLTDSVGTAWKRNF